MKKLTDTEEEAVISKILKDERCWLFEDISGQCNLTLKSCPVEDTTTNGKKILREGDEVALRIDGHEKPFHLMKAVCRKSVQNSPKAKYPLISHANITAMSRQQKNRWRVGKLLRRR